MGFTLNSDCRKGSELTLSAYTKLLPWFVKSTSGCYSLPTAHLFSMLEDSIFLNWHVSAEPQNTGNDLSDYFLSSPEDGEDGL